MPRVSVIIPVYNVAPYLRQCLDSVVNQTLRDIEIICVDDGSTDGSAAILAEYAAKDKRLKIVTQENRGHGSAWNRGLEIASGEYVYFMDADDELAAPDALARLVAVADADSLDALFFDAETRVDEGIAVPPSAVRAEDYMRRHDYSWVFSGCELFERFLTNREYTVSPCLVLLRRKFLERCGIRFPDKRIFYEDNIFMTRVMLAAERASHRPWRLYLRKVHANSTVTSAPTLRHLRGYLACYCDVCELLSRGEWSSRTRTVLRDRRAIYKLHVRRLAETNPKLVAEAKGEMSELEYATLREVLVYPFGEKIVNALRCLRDRGLFFTVKRIFFGRQDA
ncbi:MAG: glycosyltransferase [Kiritimatiellae bacterium]|nr:glycosyltransferase [Kiritimatiellia bacterium]